MTKNTPVLMARVSLLAVCAVALITASGSPLASSSKSEINDVFGPPMLTADSRPVRTDIEHERESSQPAISDNWIMTQVKARLLAEDDIDGLDVNVSASDGDVVLAGIVPSMKGRERAILIAHRVEGVQSVNAKALVVEEH